jgi:hypothetical protein
VFKAINFLRAGRAAFAAGAVAAAAAGVVFAVAATLAAYAPFPVSDQWWILTPADNLPRLFAQHNEHRLILPRLLFAVDFALFDGLNLFNLTLVHLFQALQAVVLIGLAAAAGLRGAAAAASAGLTVALLFSGAQLENFASGFQHQFTGVFAFASAGFASLAAAAAASEGGDQRRADLLTLAAAGWGALSAASMANGVAALGLAPVLAWALGLGRRRTVGLAVFFAAAAGLYLHGYVTPAHHASPLGVLIHAPDRLALYVAMYLGGPLGEAAAQAAGGGNAALRLDLAAGFGLLGLAGGAAAALGAFRAADDVRRPLSALLAVMAFIAATAFVTGLGRADFPFEQALSSRYATPALVYWAALAIHAAVWASRRRGGATAVAVAACIGAILTTAAQPAVLRLATAMGEGRLRGAAAAMAGVADWEALVHVLPYRGFDPGETDRLRAARLAVFARPWAVADHVDVGRAAPVCGGVERSAYLPSVGSSAWRGEGRASRSVVGAAVLDVEGRVVGRGLTKAGRWAAYARLPDAAGDLRIVGFRQDGAVCRLDDGAGLPSPPRLLLPGMITPVGPPFPREGLEIVGAWRENGVNAAAGVLSDWPAPPLGSWVQSDADVGRVRFTVRTAGVRRLLLPVVTGPTAAGQSVRLIAPADGRVLARLDAPADAVGWRLWLAILPEDFAGDAVVVEAEDAGAGWGQWLAVAPPAPAPAP